ncbi:MAG: Rpp14/Pop5 family protein [Candidatus Diapherotrites archaeon]|nr:Rpp14/Pop5 family protein [Candidatus Diapherotrites archaeon]
MKSFAKKTKKNPLPKTLRGKKRYALVALRSSVPLVSREVVSAVLSNQREWFGVIGLARQSLSVISFDPKTGSLVVKCALRQVEDVKAGLVLLERVGTVVVSAEIVRVSGSLKGLGVKG